MTKKQILRAENIECRFGERVIFKIPSLVVEEGMRIGLVGENGAGKSTLISVLGGERVPDEGNVVRRGRVATITQKGYALVDQDRPYCRSHMRRVFVTEKSEQSGKQSGGERTRAAIAEALHSEPDLLLADEPTTNLDMEGIEALQAALLAMRRACIIVSHDTELLEAFCEQIWEMEDGALRVFPGRLSAWREQKSRERSFACFLYERDKAERKRLAESARQLSERARGVSRAPRGISPGDARLISGKNRASEAQRGLHAKAKAILQRTERLAENKRPRSLPEIRMALGSGALAAGGPLVRAERINVTYGGRVVIDDASFELPAGKCTVMLGPNGSGKTSLLARINERGDGVRVAAGARIGYFSQDHETLDPERSALYNARSLSVLPEGEVRTILARLGIAGNDVHKPVGVLSGGERAKVAFARLFASDLNLLLLDEPTNHLDIFSAEELERLLSAWRGASCVVTHDRRLARGIASRLLLVEEGSVRSFEGNWEEYRLRH